MGKHANEDPWQDDPQHRAARVQEEYKKLRASLLEASQRAASIHRRIERDHSLRVNGHQITRIKGAVDLALDATVEASMHWGQVHRARTED